MSEQPAPRVRRRILRNLLLSFLAFCMAGFAVIGWWVTTDSFQQRVRRRVVAALEEATGGRVELGELHTIPFRLRVDARNLTIHGREGAGEVPFVQVERVQAELKIISLFEKSIGLHSLQLERPVVHIIAYPDGTTNMPAPAIKLSSDRTAIERLVSMSVAHIEAHEGRFLWQDQNVPFDFAARDVALHLDFSLLRQHYETRVTIGGAETRWAKYAEFSWSADAAFVLARHHVDIRDVTLKSGQSDVKFTGRLENYRDPQITGEYHGTLALGELAAIVHEPRLRQGTTKFAGKGSWSLRTFSFEGTLDSKELEWLDGKKVSFRNGRLQAAFAVDPARVRIPTVKATLLGGSVTGEIDITNWQSSTESPTGATAYRRANARVAGANPQRGTVRLQLSGFPIGPALVYLSGPKLPLDRVGLAGNSSGSVELAWVGSIRDADTKAKLEIASPAHPGANEIAVNGKVDGIYHAAHDEVELSALHLNTNASEIQASGSLSSNSSLHFSITSHGVREWYPLLEAVYGSPQLPFAVHGFATLTGNVSGHVSSPSLNGNLEVYDFETLIPATRRTPSQTVHWDALATALQYSDNGLAARNGSVIHGRTLAHFDASAALAGGEFGENSPFTLHVDLLNGDLAELAKMADFDRPVAGSLGLTVNLSGTRTNPHGDGHFEVHEGMAYGVVIPTARGDLRLSHDELQFNNVEARAYDASLTGNGGISISGDQFHLSFAGRNINLNHFPRLQSTRFTMDGVADFSARVSGTPELPVIDAHVRLKDLALDKQRAGDFYVDATTTGRLLDIKAHSDFEKSDLKVAGTVGLEENFPADLKLEFRDLDVVSLLSIYLPGKITGRSPINGNMQLRGPLRIPQQLKASAEVSSFGMEVEKVAVESVGPVRFEVVDQTLIIENFHLNGSGTDFTAHGRAHLAGGQEMDVGLDGTINMALFQSLNPKILARGTLGVSLSATGSLQDPILQGRLDVKNTFISHNDFPSGLSDLNGVLAFDRNRVQIQNLSGTTGGGTIALTGSATYERGVAQLDVGATAQGVRLRYPPGVSSTANANLRLTGTSNAAVLSGDVVVTKLAITPGFDFGAYFANSRQTITFTQADSLTARLRLDVHVTTTPELQMQTAIARLSGNADLRLRGTADRPVVVGRAEVLEGEISFNGNKYQLERGDVTFANPAKTQPVIDLQASTRVRDYDITVRFRGDASSPSGLKITWQSEPQLPEADVIALLALGRTQEEAAYAQQTGGSLGFGGDATNLLLNEALNTSVSSRIQKLFGVSRIKIDPQGLNSETSVYRGVQGPQLTVEQQVVSNLTVTYSTNVSVSNQQIIQGEYNITRNISIIALRDQNGVVSFDLKIRRRKK
ncbi:MAG TPA: translocation/assembly module TamB domain-containing protein [Terriglobales bacterium]|nr:translocation/assembly module TamB domain-containing protein [Terriglobales bacterium]